MTDPTSATHLQIGVIARPHGVRGELKVRLHFAGSRALWNIEKLLIAPPGSSARHYDVESVRGGAKGIILALREVDTREAADALRESVLWVERTALEPLQEGEYYLVDLVGCQVFCRGTLVGAVRDVRPDPSVDTMIVRLVNGGSADLPIVDAWVESVNIPAQRVELRSLDGLIQ